MANLCEDYPCHSGVTSDFACEFCYCPEYEDPNCAGSPKWIEIYKGRIKDCSECLLPHTSEYIKKYYKEKKNGRNKDTA